MRTIYFDGSYSKTSAGWGVQIFDGHVSDQLNKKTLDKMLLEGGKGIIRRPESTMGAELTALLKGLTMILASHYRGPICVRGDCKPVLMHFRKLTIETLASKKDFCSKERWETALKVRNQLISEGCEFQVEWVKAHNGDAANYTVDQMAQSERKRAEESNGKPTKKRGARRMKNRKSRQMV